MKLPGWNPLVALLPRLLVAILLTSVANVGRAEEPRRWNVLFAIADDWGWPNAGAYGDPAAATPNFDRLAREGTLFEQAYVSSPSCTPSRGAILTGQWHWRLEGAANLWSIFPDKFATFPETLTRNGYACGVYLKAWGPGRTETPGRLLDGKRYPSFRDFLEKKPADQPFFFWLGSSDPHRPYEAGAGKASGIDLAKIRVPKCFPDVDVVRSDIADYASEVTRFDSLVGDAIRILEERGELDRTIVIVTSDHGMPFPRGKTNLYDTGVRVPLVIRWPGKEGGRTVPDFVSLTDVAPTVLELAGLEAPAEMTGRSLRPLFTSSKSGQVDSRRDHVLFGRDRHTACQESPDPGGYPCRGLRNDRFLYIRNFTPDRWPSGTPDYPHATNPGSWLGDCDNGPTKTYMVEQQDRDAEHRRLYDLAFAKRPAEELYDLAADPDQLENVAADPRYAPERKALASQLEQELRETGDPLVVGGADALETHPYLGQGVKHPDWKPQTVRCWTFEADVTPPLGHRLLTGLRKPAESVDDPLFAKGFVLAPEGEPPVVYCSVDWAEIRNDAYDRWREALAEAAGTPRERVLVSCIHQHDTPLADLTAQKMLEEAGVDGQIIDPAFHERVVTSVAQALRDGKARARSVTQIGYGQARADGLGSNRRYTRPDGSVTYGRYSAGGSPEARNAEEGTIDPFVKSLSFWDGDQPIVVLSSYATHPMSYYGTARVSADFPGRARDLRQAATPGTLQIYASGASGNITVGKYNDGKPESRPIFADRLKTAMQAAFEGSAKAPLERVEVRSVPLVLEPRDAANFTQADLEARLARSSDPHGQELAAMGLSWRKRVERNQPIDVPVVDLGPVQLLLLPAEIYVEYQLFAQSVRPDRFVMTIGYGECAPGYIPIERAWTEHDENLGDWCWVNPGMQPRIESAIRTLLRGDRAPQ